MKLLKLGGKYAIDDHSHALVDDEDYEKASKYKWSISKSTIKLTKPYYRIHARINGKNELLHRFIMNFPDCEVDHRDRNTFNNQKSNLRLSTRSQSMVNRGKRKNKTSKYIGVRKCNKSKINKFVVEIKVNKRMIYVGRFDNEDESAYVRDLYSLYYFKDFAVLNFPNNRAKYEDEIKNYPFKIN